MRVGENVAMVISDLIFERHLKSLHEAKMAERKHAEEAAERTSNAVPQPV